MDEDTLRRRADCWRRRAAEALDARERTASAELADHYEALLIHLLDGRDRDPVRRGEINGRPADRPPSGRS